MLAVVPRCTETPCMHSLITYSRSMLNQKVSTDSIIILLFGFVLFLMWSVPCWTESNHINNTEVVKQNKKTKTIFLHSHQGRTTELADQVQALEPKGSGGLKRHPQRDAKWLQRDDSNAAGLLFAAIFCLLVSCSLVEEVGGL